VAIFANLSFCADGLALGTVGFLAQLMSANTLTVAAASQFCFLKSCIKTSLMAT
jgi:hypothetical protein